ERRWNSVTRSALSITLSRNNVTPGVALSRRLSRAGHSCSSINGNRQMKYFCCTLLWVVSSVALAQSTSHGEVTIYRDAMGVPHIVGATSAAVMYGLGYALAEDRLVQLELARRGAS